MNKLLILFFLLITCSAYGQKKAIKEHSWAKARPNIQTPAHLQGSDAFLVYQYRTVANHITDFYNGRIKTRNTVMRRVKLLTKEGVEEHSVFSIRKRRTDALVSLDARTIKDKGKPINLKTEDIKRLDVNTDASSGGYDELRFAIPGAEVGDEIEIVYATETSWLVTGMDVYLNENLPILHSVFIYRSDEQFNTNLKWVELGDPKITKDGTQVDYRWETRNVAARNQADFALRPLETPYVGYVVRDIVLKNQSTGSTRVIPVVSKDPSALFDEFVRIYGASNSTQGGVKAFVNRFRKEGLPDHQVAANIVNWINEHVDIVSTANAENVGRDIAKQIDSGAINGRDLYLFYWQLGRELKLSTKVCFGKSKFEEPFDMNFISPHQISYIFFAFPGADGKDVILFPSSSSRRYALGEYPWYLEGTQYLKTARKNVNALTTGSSLAVFPDSRYSANLDNTRMKGAVDLSSGQITLEVSATYTGNIMEVESNDLSGDLEEMAPLGFESSQVDSIATHNHGDSLSLWFRTIPMNIDLTEIEPGTFSLDISELLDYRIISGVDTSSTMLSAMPFPFTESLELELTFSQPVKELVKSQERPSKSYGVASFMLMSSLEDGKVMVNSRYTIKQSAVEGEEGKQLHAVNEFAEDKVALPLLFTTQ